MADRSGIGWTDATWNPVTGCSRVSPGCEHCYAESLSLRMGWSKQPWTAQNAEQNVGIRPDRLSEPLGWRAPRRVFVNSMSDLFHDRVPDEFLDRVFDVMRQAPRHVFQVLTKRPLRMRNYVLSRGHPGPNVWLGVSVEDQRRADERIPLLLDTPAAVHFLSCEPLLGEIDLERIYDGDEPCRTSAAVGWVIVGGESGAGFREMDLGWLCRIVHASHEARVPVFVKQDSGYMPGKQGRIPDKLWARKEYPK